LPFGVEATETAVVLPMRVGGTVGVVDVDVGDVDVDVEVAGIEVQVLPCCSQAGRYGSSCAQEKVRGIGRLAGESEKLSKAIPFVPMAAPP
jgi:hypothetical protein